MSVEAFTRHGKSRDAKFEWRRREFLFVAQDGKCCLCGGTMNLSHPRSDGYASFEHLIPRRSSHNGKTQARKIRKAPLILLSHRRCNNERDVAPVSSALIERANTLWQKFKELEAMVSEARRERYCSHPTRPSTARVSARDEPRIDPDRELPSEVRKEP